MQSQTSTIMEERKAMAMGGGGGGGGTMIGPPILNINGDCSRGSRSVECFEKLELIGEGTYGQVYKARERKTGEIVALKKVRMENEEEGFPITAIREIKILQKLRHENVIRLKEIVTAKATEKGSIYMVFEYMDHDLKGLADRPGMRFSIPQIKCYMKQLLKGLHYCHVNGVLHRDIKASNLLIDNKGVLKLADFGLARSFCRDIHAKMTNRVVTLWYRPPELLMGANKYGPSVDMWSVGCVFAELLTGKALFPGEREEDVLHLIFHTCGFPDESTWPGVSKIQLYNRYKQDKAYKGKKLIDALKQNNVLESSALKLAERLLTLDPDKRLSAKDALDSDYFWTDPMPCDPGRETLRRAAVENGDGCWRPRGGGFLEDVWPFRVAASWNHASCSRASSALGCSGKATTCHSRVSTLVPGGCSDFWCDDDVYLAPCARKVLSSVPSHGEREKLKARRYAKRESPLGGFRFFVTDRGRGATFQHSQAAGRRLCQISCVEV
ncbi:hypothetical protein CBR_g17928 [Chara braunii]|uniref:Protein kinase domain-containing protein n=1 Tax=Chara braunii TaxID=69332 RepID=A0A388KVX2_CHABU|nr:hypothetical protein CBR_g17928 [Chara braunii]|eukprot:GBG74215.1 hypothetical protein CBR_g17928 [Chara braunii]